MGLFRVSDGTAPLCSLALHINFNIIGLCDYNIDEQKSEVNIGGAMAFSN